MNKRMREPFHTLMWKASIGYNDSWSQIDPEVLEKFAELIVEECAKLNKHQSYELMGVIADVEEGDGFDDVCLNTVKRVAEHLAKDLKEHFGIEK
jgi:hypothetical protein